MHFNKIISDYKKHGNQKFCFYKDKTNCSSKIKKAHSIQKNKILTQLEGKIKNNQLLYSLYSTEADEDFNVIKLVPIGKKSASVFTGFCDYHDSTIFSPIENFDFDFTEQQKFLLTYRAFAHAFHQLSEIYKYYLSDGHFVKSWPKDYLEGHIKLTEYRLWKVSKYKILIDNIMEIKNYSGIEYHIRVIKPFVPIASSTILTPMYTPKNRYLNTKTEDSYLVLNVLPDTNRTIIMLSNFHIDKMGKILFDELKSLNDDQFTAAISSLMIYSTENTFFSPELWNRFTPTLKQTLFDEINFCVKYGDKIDGFFNSKINFFKI